PRGDRVEELCLDSEERPAGGPNAQLPRTQLRRANQLAGETLGIVRRESPHQELGPARRDRRRAQADEAPWCQHRRLETDGGPEATSRCAKLERFAWAREPASPPVFPRGTRGITAGAHKLVDRHLEAFDRVRELCAQVGRKAVCGLDERLEMTCPCGSKR